MSALAASREEWHTCRMPAWAVRAEQRTFHMSALDTGGTLLLLLFLLLLLLPQLPSLTELRELPRSGI